MFNSADLMAFVATLDAERARTFYQDVLGLTFVEDQPFALVFEANGTMLRISKVRELNPVPYTVLGWQVPDIAHTMEQLSGRGITFERFEGFVQDENAVMTFPDGTKVAWFKDPDGNLLSVTQFPPAF